MPLRPSSIIWEWSDRIYPYYLAAGFFFFSFFFIFSLPLLLSFAIPSSSIASNSICLRYQKNNIFYSNTQAKIRLAFFALFRVAFRDPNALHDILKHALVWMSRLGREPRVPGNLAQRG